MAQAHQQQQQEELAQKLFHQYQDQLELSKVVDKSSMKSLSLIIKNQTKEFPCGMRTL